MLEKASLVQTLPCGAKLEVRYHPNELWAGFNITVSGDGIEVGANLVTEGNKQSLQLYITEAAAKEIKKVLSKLLRKKKQ